MAAPRFLLVLLPIVTLSALLSAIGMLRGPIGLYSIGSFVSATLVLAMTVRLVAKRMTPSFYAWTLFLSFNVIIAVYAVLSLNLAMPGPPAFSKQKTTLFIVYLLIVAFNALRDKRVRKGQNILLDEPFQRMLTFYLWLAPLWMLYLLNNTILNSSDTKGASLLPFTIFSEGNFTLTEYFGTPKIMSTLMVQESASDIISRGWLRSPIETGSGYYVHPYNLIARHGELYSVFPLLPGLCNSAIYALFALSGWALHQSPVEPSFSYGLHLLQDYYLERTSAAIIATAGSYVIYRICRFFLPVSASIGLTAVYSVASAHWPISSQALWQHGINELLFGLFIYFFIIVTRDEKSDTRGKQWMGLITALLIFNRPTTIFLTLPFWIGLAFRDWKRADTPGWEGAWRLIQTTVLPSLTLFLPAYACIAVLNWNIYGNILGGYAIQDIQFLTAGAGYFALANIPRGFTGLLFSPSRGLLIFMPYLAFSLLGFLRDRTQLATQCAGFSFVSYFSFFCTVLFWHGDWSYGPRYLIDGLPTLLLLLIPVIRNFKKSSPVTRFAFFGSVFFSLMVQYTGVFHREATGRWHACNLAQYEDAVTQWSNPQFLMPLKPYKTLLPSAIAFYPAVFECGSGKTMRSDGWHVGYERVIQEIPIENNPIDSKNYLYYETGLYLRAGTHCLKAWFLNTNIPEDGFLLTANLGQDNNAPVHDGNGRTGLVYELRAAKNDVFTIHLQTKRRIPGLRLDGLEVTSGSCR